MNNPMVQASMTAALGRMLFVAAPAFLFLYGIAYIIDGWHGVYGPGIAWTLGHTMLLLALLAFGGILFELRWRAIQQTTGHLLPWIAFIAALLGLLVLVRVSLIDIISGLKSGGDHSTMKSISRSLNDYPNAALRPYYEIGPFLFQLGMLALLIQLAMAKPRQLPWWSPVLVLFGFVILAFDLNLLLLGAALIGFALVPLVVSRRPARRNA